MKISKRKEGNYLQTKVIWPVHWWIEGISPLWLRRLGRKIRDIKWRLIHRLHPNHRYHVVKTGLAPGYHDKVELVLHTNFNLLKDFVETERPFVHFDVQDSHHRDQWKKLFKVYRYWTRHRPRIIDGEPEFPCLDLIGLVETRTEEERATIQEWAKKHWQWEERLWDSDQRWLKELIDIRGHLWT